MRQHLQNTPFCKKRWDLHLQALAIASRKAALQASSSAPTQEIFTNAESMNEADSAFPAPDGLPSFDPSPADETWMDIDDAIAEPIAEVPLVVDVPSNASPIGNEDREEVSMDQDDSDEWSDDETGDEMLGQERAEDEGDDPEYSICPSMDLSEELQVTEVFERAGRIIDRTMSHFDSLRSKQLKDGGGNIYYPFSCSLEWDVAKWLHESRMPLSKIDQFMQLNYVRCISLRNPILIVYLAGKGSPLFFQEWCCIARSPLTAPRPKDYVVCQAGYS
jgi:hypothetical protein